MKVHDGWIWQLASRGARPGDSEEVRLKKALLTVVAGIIAPLALLWGAVYALAGYPWSGLIPLSYALISFLSMRNFFRTGQFEFFRFSQLLLILLLPFVEQWSLGGFSNGSVVMVWGFFSPLAASFFGDQKSARRWLAAFFALTVVSGLLDSTVAAHAAPMPRTINTLYFVMNMCAGFIAVYVVVEAAYRRVKENEARIRELTLTDPLTGVANRRSLDERLTTELGRQRRHKQELAVIMADLDYFKQVNDRYGHATGDELLVSFASLIRDAVRTTDLVARYGGEEFVIVLPETTHAGALELAERVRGALETQRVAKITSVVTASFGVTTAHGEDSPQSVLDRADQALYQAKHDGRNRVVGVAAPVQSS